MSDAAAPASRDRTPWIVPGVALAEMLALMLVLLLRDSPRRPVSSNPEIPAAAPAGGSPPDISNQSPRERFNQLYNRIMTAAQSGDEGTVTPPLWLRDTGDRGAVSEG